MTSLEERNRLIASHQDASDAFDRALMTLSAGSLGLSIAFVKDIAPDPVAVAVLETSRQAPIKSRPAASCGAQRAA